MFGRLPKISYLCSTILKKQTVMVYSWYFVVFVISSCILLVSAIISMIFGGADFDIDMDGDVDGDLSSMLSPKGFLHFAIGFSSYLLCVGYNGNHSVREAYSFGIGSYVMAILVGLFFMVFLYFTYQEVSKLGHKVDTIEFDGRFGTVYTSDGEGNYDVLIETPSGKIKKSVTSIDKTKHIGDLVKVKLDAKTNTYYI